MKPPKHARPLSASLVGASMLLGALVSCGTVAGLGDDFFTAPDLDASADAPPPDTAPPDAPLDGSVPSDAADVDSAPLDAPDVPDSPVDAPPDAPEAGPVDSGPLDSGPGVENCTNGKDDNGDGLVDCEDPECQAGYTCGSAFLPTTNGWTLGLFDETGRPACPIGYGSPTAVIDDVRGAPATCQCACDTVTPAHCEGTADYATNGGGGGPCPPASSQSHVPYSGRFDSTGVLCALPNTPEVVPDKTNYTTSGTSRTVPGSCTPRNVVTAPSVTANHGETCAATGHGAGCGGGACVAKPTAGFSVCSFKPGGTCPGGLVQTIVNLGDGIDDSRACAGCACGTTSDLACTFRGIQFYPNTTCAPVLNGAFYVPAGQCVPSNPPGDFGALGILGGQNGNDAGCAPTSPSRSNDAGASAGGTSVTVCCLP